MSEWEGECADRTSIQSAVGGELDTFTSTRKVLVLVNVIHKADGKRFE